jgi:hypothetical protein
MANVTVSEVMGHGRRVSGSAERGSTKLTIRRRFGGASVTRGGKTFVILDRCFCGNVPKAIGHRGAPPAANSQDYRGAQ